jgi:hypothetical protein
MTIKQKQIKDTLHDSCIIHNATSNDIESMVRLSKLKRLDYEKAQPQFWRHAPDAEIQQATWFKLYRQVSSNNLSVHHND